MHDTRRILLLATVPVILAGALRAHGLGWGLPDLLEEATPFHQAWQMWGWGEGRFDPDPGFYRYPSLAIYAHALAQAFLLVFVRIAGGAEALHRVPVEFLADPVPFLLASRIVSALFGVAAVAGTFALGRRLGGTVGGLVAGLLLAVNAYHVDRSQFIEVDAALVCFVAWGLWASVRLLAAPSLRNHLVAGALLGLATSAKYPGALLAIPLLVAHAQSGGARRWRRAAAAGGVAIAVFALTSPFVLLELEAAWGAIAAERQHMQRGHFGLDDAPTWRFYVQVIPERLLGWPLALAATAGAIVGGFVRRRREAIPVLAFVVAYAAIVASWEMRTERYLLPLLPGLVALAAGLVRELPARRRLATALVGTALLAVPSALALPGVWSRTAPENRTLAREWIEEKCPEGSFLVVEPWGPDLLEPEELWRLTPRERRAFWDLQARPLYAIQTLPSYQVMPELAEAFYDLDVYADADLIVLSSDVGDRYRREPERYAQQLAFYESLERRLHRIAEFDAGAGPRITMYFQPQPAPFGRRTEVAGPRPLAPGLRRPPPGEAAFYRRLGLNYETFGFLDEAIDAYRRGLAVRSLGAEEADRIGRGLARCFVDRDDVAGAARALREAAARSPDDAIRQRLLDSADRLEGAE